MRPTTDEIAAAVADVDTRVAYGLNLFRLVDGVHTYRLQLDGRSWEFIDSDEMDALDQAYERIRAEKNRLRAEALYALFDPRGDEKLVHERLRAVATLIERGGISETTLETDVARALAADIRVLCGG